YLELKVEAILKGASDVIPCFTGFVDIPIENEELSNTARFTAFSVDDLGTRIAAENVSAQPLKSNADGAGHAGLILPYVFGMYVVDANISTKVLKVGVHTITYQYNGGTRRAKLDNGAFVNLSNGNNTLGNVDNSTGDTERVKVYANPVSGLPATDYAEKIVVLTAGDTVPYRYYKDVNARFILSKLFDAIGLTSQTFDTLEQRTYDGAKRVSYIDTPPNNNGVVVATKDAIETDETDLFVAIDDKIYKRNLLTGVYTLLVSGLAHFPEKLMYNARNNHLWMYYGAGSLQRYDIGGATLSSEIVLNVTTSNLSHFSVKLYDYNYTGSSWKYGVIYCDRNGGTSQGLFRICDGSSLALSTIVSGATLGYTGGAGVYQYFMHFMTGGKVRFRAINNSAQNCYREYSVNSSGVWTDGGEKLAGIEDYRMAAYHSAEGRIYYAFLEGGPNYMTIKSHTDASTSVTSIYNSADPSAVSGTAYYAAGDAAVY